MRNLSSRVKRFFTKPSWPKLLVLLVIIIVVVIFGVASKTYIGGGKMALIKTPIGQMILAPYRMLRKTSDIFYFGYEFKSNDLPVYKLEIKPDDLKFLNDNLPEPFSGNRLTSEYRERVSAKFYFNGKEYKVKVRYRGNVSNHWANAKKSWDINFDKDNPFNGLDGINLIIPEDRGIVLEHTNNYRAKKMGLFPLHTSYAVLKVNGKNHGLYFQVEPWDENYLVKHELIDDAKMFEYYEDWSDSSGNLYSFEQLSNFDQKSGDGIGQDEDYAPLNIFIDLVNNASDVEFAKKIPEVVDLDRFLAWQAHHMLASSFHSVGRNTRFFVDRETGKMVFVPWDVSMWDPESVLEKSVAKFYNRMLLVPEFAYQRNQILWEYVKDKDNLEDDLKFYDQELAKIKAAMAQDHLKLDGTSWFFDEVKRNREQIIANFESVKEVLKKAQVSVVVHYQDNLPQYFDVVTENFSEMMIEEIRLYSESGSSGRLIFDQNNNGELDSGDKEIGVASDIGKGYHVITPEKEIIMSADKKSLSDDAFEDFVYQPKAYRFFLAWPNNSYQLDKIKIEIENAITFKNADQRTQDVYDDNYQYLSLKSSSVDEFISRYPIFRKINDSAVRLVAGGHLIERDVIVPSGVSLAIDAGTNIFFGPGASLISYGSIEANGTSGRPIIINGVGGQIWGVVAISEGNRISTFKNVRFSDGSDAYINGVYYSGMLSAYRSDIEISNSWFHRAGADDALNVKTAQVTVKDSFFIKNSADAIDFDFIKSGEVSGSQFLDNGNDGIDLSGSTIVIEDNQIIRSGDKGISVGERSIGTIIRENTIDSCDIGVEVKDLSDIDVTNNAISNNGIGINAYQKKEIFGGGRVEVGDNTFLNNDEDTRADEQSEIILL